MSLEALEELKIQIDGELLKKQWLNIYMLYFF